MRVRILGIIRVAAILGVMVILGAAFLRQGSLLIRQAGDGIPVALAVPLAQDNDNADGAPPPAAPAAAPPPPPPSVVSACVSAGQELVLALPGGNARVRVFGQSVQFTLRAVDPSTVPPTPGPRVDDLVWEMTASACGGAAHGQLPAEVNVGVDYLPSAAAGLNQANFRIAVWDGTQWSPSPKQATDPANSFVSATETRLGTYTVYQS
jgi:hypothetical protein